MITYRELRKTDWPQIEKLFGDKGACGGCWCMYWRLPRGGKLWEEMKGARNKREFKKLLSAGRVRGILAFDRTQAVGWCSFGPRADLVILGYEIANQCIRVEPKPFDLFQQSSHGVDFRGPFRQENRLRSYRLPYLRHRASGNHDSPHRTDVLLEPLGKVPEDRLPDLLQGGASVLGELVEIRLYGRGI